MSQASSCGSDRLKTAMVRDPGCKLSVGKERGRYGRTQNLGSLSVFDLVCQETFISNVFKNPNFGPFLSPPTEQIKRK